MSLPGHPIPGPDRERPDTMDHEVEAGAQRVRHHLRRPLAGSRNLLMKTAGNTVAVTDPTSLVRKDEHLAGARGPLAHGGDGVANGIKRVAVGDQRRGPYASAPEQLQG